MRLKVTKRVTSSGFITWWAEATWHNLTTTFYSTDRFAASWSAVEHCFWAVISAAWNEEQHA